MSTKRRGLGMQAWIIVFTVMSVGFGTFVLVVVRGLVSDTRDYVRMEAPGRAEMDLKYAGKYVIFYEYERTRDSQGVLRGGGIDDLAFLVLDPENPVPIQVVDVGRPRNYHIRRTVGEAVREFVVPAPGRYEFSATSSNSEDVPKINLAVGRPYNDRIIGAFLAGMIPLAVTFAIIALTLFLAHRRAQSRPEVMVSAP